MKRTFSTMDVDTSSSQIPLTQTTTISRGRKRPRGSGTGGGKLTKRQKQEVKTLIHRQQELKFFAFSSGAGTAVSTTGSISNAPFQVSQGVLDTNRIGDALMFAGTLELTLEVVNSLGVGADNYNNMRVMLFQWKPNSTPGFSEILLNGPSGAPDCWSVYNHDTRQEYSVIYDKVFHTEGNAQAATSPMTGNTTTGIRKFFISLKRIQKHVQYSGGGTTGTNLLYILLVSDSAAAPHPSITYSTKMFFRDA